MTLHLQLLSYLHIMPSQYFSHKNFTELLEYTQNMTEEQAATHNRNQQLFKSFSTKIYDFFIPFMYLEFELGPQPGGTEQER